jgi:hypothetical protein
LNHKVTKTTKSFLKRETFWCPVAYVEQSVLDLLDKVAGRGTFRYRKDRDWVWKSPRIISRARKWWRRSGEFPLLVQQDICTSETPSSCIQGEGAFFAVAEEPSP